MKLPAAPCAVTRCLLTLSTLSSYASSSSIMIHEIARKGSEGICNGEDWLELFNNSTTEAVDLSQGYLLHDDKGMNDLDAFSFDAFVGREPLPPQGYLVLCTKASLAANTDPSLEEIPDPLSPQFGIGKSDTLTLLRIVDEDYSENSQVPTTSRNIGYTIVSSVGPLPGLVEEELNENVTYAYDAATGTYQYTSAPTPGAANVMSPLKTREEVTAEHKTVLAQQNDQGTAFFNFGLDGLPVEDGMDEMLQLHITMTPEDYAYTLQNASFEVYRPFLSATITDMEGRTLQEYNAPGRIRPKGQTSLYIAQCIATDTIPFQIDMDETDPTQTLFGVQRFYLRTHLGDYSYMRDWSYNRMLARFGLPHLRARSVQLIINENVVGPIYTLVEAPDQEYVFSRNFPNYAPESFALYKITNLDVTCGQYSKEEIASAAQRLNTDSGTPPYLFERGTHRPPVEQLGAFDGDQCIENYFRDAEGRDREDVVLAWLRYDQDCAKMRMEEGLIDRDLGQKEWDVAMEDFVRQHLDVVSSQCDQNCANSNLGEDIDLDNFLKTMAFYAVTLDQDSPIGNGNNYYLAQAGDGLGWKLQAYDFNFPFPAGCQTKVCDERLVHWSILRPTCTALEDNMLAGPLLTDPVLQRQYLAHVQTFVDTIYTNSSLTEQMTNHINATRPFINKDIYGAFGAYVGNEMSLDAASWREGATEQFPLLPTMKARGIDVKAQLDAIDAGTFKRGPIIGMSDNEPWEVCSDWRETEPPKSNCELGCQYEGCHMPGWTVQSYCDEEAGICYHGDVDERCENIAEGARYVGMESRLDGSLTFCRYAQGIPVATSECPSSGSIAVTLSQSAAGASLIARSWRWSLSLVALIAFSAIL